MWVYCKLDGAPSHKLCTNQQWKVKKESSEKFSQVASSVRKCSIGPSYHFVLQQARDAWWSAGEIKVEARVTNNLLFRLIALFLQCIHLSVRSLSRIVQNIQLSSWVDGNLRTHSLTLLFLSLFFYLHLSSVRPFIRVQLWYKLKITCYSVQAAKSKQICFNIAHMLRYCIYASN